MERIIRVTGKGNLSVKPDLIRLLLTLENKGEEYAETARQATEYVEELKQCFEELGFERADLKTRSYSIDTEYEYYRVNERERKQRLVVSRHSLKIEFDADNNRLGQILYALAHTSVKPEFRIEYVEELKQCFEELGFERADLKTRSYSIDTEYEHYQVNEREWKQRFVGYISRHSLKIEFDADNNRLGQILYALAHTSVKPEFRIEYTVKDKEGAKNLLLSKAVADSKEKAQVLVTAAGVKLGDVATIDYSWDDIEMVSRPLCGEVFAMNDIDSTVESYKMSIEPEDITISDSVTVVWMIE